MRRPAISAGLACAASLAALGCGAAATQVEAPPVQGALAAPRVVPGDLDPRVVLGDVPDRATKLGAGPLAIVAGGELVEGERVGAFVVVPEGACLLAYARGSSSFEDIDVAAFADEGSPVAVDESPDPRPTILLCPPHPDRVYLAVHAANGEGFAVLGAQLVPKDRAHEVALTLGARGGIATRAAEAWPGLDDRVRAHRTALGGAWEEQRRVAVPLDVRVPSLVAFGIDADACTDALVVPDEELASLDVEAIDDAGRLLARAHDIGPDRTLTVCSPLATVASLSIRPHAGRGVAAVVVSKAKGEVARDLSARPEIAWTTPTASLDSARAAKSDLLAKAGYGPPRHDAGGALVLGRRASHVVELGGGCARIDVVAGAPLALVEATARDDAGSLLGSADGADGATLFTCGHPRAHVEVEARGRPGPYALLVRPEPWSDPAFAAHPLAAGRMLSRAATAPGGTFEGTQAAVRSMSLDAARLFAMDESIAPGQCVRVAAGAEGEGAGIELRLSEAQTGDDLDRSHGQHAASVRACAGSGPRTVRIELRVTAGKLDVVLGERRTP